MSSCNETLLFCYMYLVLLLFNNRVECSETEEKLLRNLFIHYDKNVLPSQPDHTIIAKIDFQLTQIEFDDSKGLFTASAHFVAEWDDPKLKWKPSEYGNISLVHLKKNEVWLPDISLYNSFGNKALDISDSGIMLLENTGLVIWSMNVRMKTLCDLDMFRWPYDNHKCLFRFGSWFHHGLHLDLFPSNKLEAVKGLTENSEFIVTNFTAHRYQTFYNCCAEPYITLEYHIEFARRSSAFVTIFVVPAFCVVILTLAAFWLPPHRGEKILLNGLTLVVIAMYQLYFIANHSTFSLTIPLIALFYSLSFVLVTISMIISVLVLASSRTLYKGHLPPGLCKILKSRICVIFGPTDDCKEPDQIDLSCHEGEKSFETYSLISTKNSYDEWTSLGIILARVSFVIYSGIYLLFGFVCYI